MTSYNTADLAQIKNIECFLLDMDGTIYLGDTVIDGTFDFLDILKKLNKKAMYITNNSSRATIQYVEKLSASDSGEGRGLFYICKCAGISSE